MYRAIKAGSVLVGGVSRSFEEGELIEDLSDADVETLTTHGWVEEARGEKAKPESAESKRKADETRITGQDDDKTLTTKSAKG